jgi:GNAT superfamily N-acetyltransferase
MHDSTLAAAVVVLADGEAITVRPLHPEDDDAFEAAIARADVDDLRRRFLGGPPPMWRLLHYLHSADGWHDIVLGAFSSDGRLVGVVQCDRIGEVDAAELAIEVAGDYQHRGLATLLLDDLERRARLVGVTTFTANYYSDNLAISRLLSNTGQVIDRSSESGVSTVALDIRERKPISMPNADESTRDVRTYWKRLAPLVARSQGAECG